MANTPLLTIISDAYRESNITNINSVLTQAQQDEGMRLLARIIGSVYGNEAGENLSSFPIGRVGVTTPGDFPPHFPANQFFPLNVRVALNLDQPRTILLYPDPEDGSMFAVVDENSTTLDVTIDANGRRIEGNPTYEFNEVHGFRMWMYDATTGVWNVISPLTIDDVCPFPEMFDDMFVIMLAMRLNPRYTTTLAPESIAALKSITSKFKARYAQSVSKQSELALLLTPNIRRERGYYYGYGYGSPTNVWNTGYPFGGIW